MASLFSAAAAALAPGGGLAFTVELLPQRSTPPALEPPPAEGSGELGSTPTGEHIGAGPRIDDGEDGGEDSGEGGGEGGGEVSEPGGGVCLLPSGRFGHSVRACPATLRIADCNPT